MSTPRQALRESLSRASQPACPNCGAHLNIVEARRARTPRQKQVYEFIEQFIAEHGYSPKFIDIKAACGITSHSSLDRALARLEQGKWIVRTSGRHRSISIASASVQSPPGDAGREGSRAPA